jgi:hypothetical protein
VVVSPGASSSGSAAKRKSHGDRGPRRVSVASPELGHSGTRKPPSRNRSAPGTQGTTVATFSSLAVTDKARGTYTSDAQGIVREPSNGSRGRAERDHVAGRRARRDRCPDERQPATRKTRNFAVVSRRRAPMVTGPRGPKWRAAPRSRATQLLRIKVSSPKVDLQDTRRESEPKRTMRLSMAPAGPREGGPPRRRSRHRAKGRGILGGPIRPTAVGRGRIRARVRARSRGRQPFPPDAVGRSGDFDDPSRRRGVALADGGRACPPKKDDVFPPGSCGEGGFRTRVRAGSYRPLRCGLIVWSCGALSLCLQNTVGPPPPQRQAAPSTPARPPGPIRRRLGAAPADRLLAGPLRKT